MCPDRKLEWFKKCPYFSNEDVKRIKAMAIKRWKESYNTNSQGLLSSEAPALQATLHVSVSLKFAFFNVDDVPLLI